MRKFILIPAILLGLVLPEVSVRSETGASVATPESQQSPPKAKRWKGTATATCVCADGRCVPLGCTVSGQLSYEAARNVLRFNLETQARLNNGRLDGGSVSFSISAEW